MNLLKIYLKSFSCNTGSIFLSKVENLLKEYKGIKVISPDRKFFGNNMDNNSGDILEVAKYDLCIIDGCSIMDYVEREYIKYINKLKNENKNIRVILTGCASQYKPTFKKLSNLVSYATNTLPDLLNYITSISLKADGSKIPKKKQPETADTENIISDNKGNGIMVRWGCDNNCSYCVVPLLRKEYGGVRCTPSDAIISAINQKKLKSSKFIMLSGVCISSWFEKKGGQILKFNDLLKRVFNETKSNLEYISVNPGDIDYELLKILLSKRIKPPIMIAAQSASDKILKRMNRRYDSKKIKKIFKFFKNNGLKKIITTDIIVGFPGEKEEDLEKNINFIKKFKDLFYKIKLSRYSKRKGTLASRFKGQVAMKDIKKNLQRYKDICEQLEIEYDILD